MPLKLKSLRADQHRKRHAVSKKKTTLSVTGDQTVTRINDHPVKRYVALRPWLDFANVASPLVRGVPYRLPQRESRTRKALTGIREFMELEQETDTFPAQLLRAFLTQATSTGLDADLYGKTIADLTDNVIGVLDYYAGLPLPPETPPYVVSCQSFTQVSIAADRVALKSLGDPFGNFVQVINGIEAKRIGRCPCCDRFFFAVRNDQPGCSRKCATALRVRKLRNKEAEAIAMARAGKTIQEIARALSVSEIQARRYIRKHGRRTKPTITRSPGLEPP